MAKNGIANNLFGSINNLFASLTSYDNVLSFSRIFYLMYQYLMRNLRFVKCFLSWFQCIFPSKKSCIQSAPFDGQFFKCILSFLYSQVNWIVNRMSVRHITNRNKETCTYFGILYLFAHLALKRMRDVARL